MTELLLLYRLNQNISKIWFGRTGIILSINNGTIVVLPRKCPFPGTLMYQVEFFFYPTIFGQKKDKKGDPSRIY